MKCTILLICQSTKKKTLWFALTLKSVKHPGTFILIPIFTSKYHLDLPNCIVYLLVGYQNPLLSPRFDTILYLKPHLVQMQYLYYVSSSHNLLCRFWLSYLFMITSKSNIVQLCESFDWHLLVTREIPPMGEVVISV